MAGALSGSSFSVQGHFSLPMIPYARYERSSLLPFMSECQEWPLDFSLKYLRIDDMRTFEYRLYPTKKQEHALMQVLIASRRLYNEMLVGSDP
jgi:Helix-turn-helix domain